VVAFLAFSYVSYDPPTTPRINVRWSADATQADRETRAAAYGLASPRLAEERTWSYAVLETSTDNIRQLVQDPTVEDTYGIDRTTFELVAPLTAPMNVLFRWLGISSLIGLVAGLAVTWMGPKLEARLAGGRVGVRVPRPATLRHWSQAVIDAGSGALAPLVVFVVLFDDVVAANVRELVYQPLLVRWFHAVALVVAGFGVWLVRRVGPRIPVRMWLAVPWAILLLDVVGATTQGSPIGLAIVVDVLMIAAVVTVAMVTPWPEYQTVAAVATVAFMIQTGMAHAALVRGLTPEMIAREVVPDRVPEPGAAPRADAPGNVYHILLDNYLAESYAALATPKTRATLPGFTFFSRFNSQFPRTVTSELALLHGRFPRAGMSLDDWPQTVLREGLWRDLASAGIDVWVYPYSNWLCPDYAAACVAGSDLEQRAQATLTQDATIDLWALRLMPGSMRRLLAGEDRNAVGYSVTDALRRGLGLDTSGQSPSAPLVSANPGQYFNLRQFDRVLADEALRPARGQYVYYHGLIPHPQYLLDEQCEPVQRLESTTERYFDFARCANLMVARLVDVLAQLGRLDDALIIVHADHGDVEFLASPESPLGPDAAFALDPAARRYQQPDPTYQDDAMLDRLYHADSATWRSIAVEVLSSALLLVKFPAVTTYSEDTRPVQLLDLAPTILEHAGASIAPYDGLPISRVPSTRDQVFYAHSRNFDASCRSIGSEPRAGISSKTCRSHRSVGGDALPGSLTRCSGRLERQWLTQHPGPAPPPLCSS
jgi:hypothetical protein